MVFKQSEVFWRQRDIPVESLLETARALEREGRVAAAAAAYRQLMRVSPNDPDALIGLSELSARLGNLNASVDALRPVCRRYPDNHALQFRLAEREHARGHNEVATTIWRQMAQRDPQDGADYRWRGQALEKLGRIDEARAAYVVSAKIAPDDAETFCDLGRLDISAGRNRDGLRNLLRAIELSPKDGLPLSWLARAMLSQDRLEEALKAASTAVERRYRRQQVPFTGRCRSIRGRLRHIPGWLNSVWRRVVRMKPMPVIRWRWHFRSVPTHPRFRLMRSWRLADSRKTCPAICCRREVLHHR